MIKIKYLLFLSLLSSTFDFAQNCDCENNFQWVKKTFEENDAGFQYAIDIKGKKAYDAHNQEFLNKIKNVKNKFQCSQTIYEWLKFFRNGHFAITNNEYLDPNEDNEIASAKQNSKWETVSINQKNFESYLATKRTEDIEGIWETDPYLIGIKKFKNDYKGFIIKSGAEIWKPNEVKLEISADQKTGTYFLRDKSSQKIENIEYLGKNYIKINDFYLKRISPKYEKDADVETYMKSLNAQKPYLDEINKTTLLLRIPSFDGSQKKNIDSVLVANKQKLNSTENLIIDLRNNGGGSDNSYSAIIPYIYTNPIRIVRTQMYSTELNNKRMLDFYNNYEKYGYTIEDSEYLKKAYDKLNANLGKFVMIQGNGDGKTIDEEKLDDILPYPKNVGIIINNNNGSTTEQFLLAAKQSKKVKLFGTTTAGVLDISNMYFVDSPCKEFKLGYALSKSLRIPDMAIDGKGISPDFYIDKSMQKYKWIDFVTGILNEKKL